jgi:3-oxoacyl-[acyl-carrier-protein] synthase-3
MVLSTLPTAVLKGYGAYLPQRILLNADLPAALETSDEWIQQRTGIKQRHIAARDETTATLATNAARHALENADVAATTLDLILVATSTPDTTFPSVASKVQHLLRAYQAAAFDVQAVCAGFVYALSTANSFIKSGQYKTVLVIGAETFSRIVDWQDRSTCVLFGDGAGAFVLQVAPANNTHGILNTHLYTNGRHTDMLYTDGGASSTETVGKVRMNGKEVFKHAVEYMSAAAEKALEDAGLTIADIDWLVPHQANSRIIEAVGKRLKIPVEKVVITVDSHANTSAASIPLAFCAAATAGKITEGQRVLLVAMGAGFTWGSAILRV